MNRFAPLSRWLLFGLLLAWLGAVPAARAHEARPAYLEIEETARGHCTLLWRTPVLAGIRLPVVLGLPDGVRDLREPVVQQLADSLVERRWIEAGLGLTKDPDDLLFLEPGLAHRISSAREILSYHLARDS